MTNQPAGWGSPDRDPYGEANPTKPIPYAYGPDAWREPAYGDPAQKTSGMAIASLVLSIAGLFCGVTALFGIICGHIALSQINRTGEHGRGLAIAGLVIGYVCVVLFSLFLVVLFLLAAANTG
jgi:hypothetical protein